MTMPDGAAIKIEPLSRLSYAGFPGDCGFEEIAHPNPWKSAMRARLYSAVRRDGLCSFAEIGAHIGTATIPASAYFRSVYAFEPSSRNLACLRHNLELNHVRNVRALHMALSDHAGRERFYLYPDANAVGHSLTESVVRPGAPYEEVEVNTLDGALPDVRDCAMIQVDAEGHDVRILLAGREFIRRQANPPVIALEFSPQMLMRGGSSAKQLTAFMAEMDYRAYIDAGNNWSAIGSRVIEELYDLWSNTCCGWLDLYLLPRGERFGGMFPEHLGER